MKKASGKETPFVISTQGIMVAGTPSIWKEMFEDDCIQACQSCPWNKTPDSRWSHDFWYFLRANNLLSTLQQLVEEMEARIEQCHLKGVDDNEAVAKANVAKAAKSKKGKTPRKAPAGWSHIKILKSFKILSILRSQNPLESMCNILVFTGMYYSNRANGNV